MAFKSLLGTLGVCLFISSFSSHAALIGRDLDGNNTTAEAYYDTDLNITWLADANITGVDTWDNQDAWAAGLSIGGAIDWRLPNMNINGDGTAVNCSGGGVAGCEDNEMGYLFWEEGITSATPGPFINIQSDNNYWSLSTSTINPDTRWCFEFANGANCLNNRVQDHYAWAVHDGSVGESVIPIPAAAWLFGSGLIGLIGIARRKKI